MVGRPLILIILDGWGVNPRKDSNAIALAQSPIWNATLSRYPQTTLDASGLAVGLRKGLMGNSEVGHMNIGAGRVVWQDITRIDKSIDDGSFFEKPAFTGAVSHIQSTGGALHLMGLLSEGGVHTSEKHYMALIDFIKRKGIAKDRSFFHVFLDGRDTPNNSGVEYVRRLQRKLDELNCGRIATVCGRYWAMDRDKRWERVERAFNALVIGEGKAGRDPVKVVEEAYKGGETDEFVSPTVIVDEAGAPVGKIANGDAVIFFNFRADRTREMVRALTEADFDGFPRKSYPNPHIATMTRYHEDFSFPIAFEPISLNNLLGQVIGRNGLSQLRIAETEKYAHVTFFFNGGSDTPCEREERILIPSPKVATYDMKPEMSAYEVTDRVVNSIERGLHDVIVLNYANPDMLGHTGLLPAAIKGVEAVDRSLGRVLSAIGKKGGVCLITADHGNCEQMIDYATGLPHTYHTTNPVPFIAVGSDLIGAKLRSGGSHKDISPTILRLLAIPQPAEMEGVSLIV